MASNVAVKITADVIDLQTKFAIAKAESQALSRSFNDLAKQAAGGGFGEKLKGDLTQAAGSMLQAKNRAAELASEIKQVTPQTVSLTSAFQGLNGVLGYFGAALGVGTLVAFAREIFNTATETQRNADILGLTTTTYQAFIESARLASASVETVDTALRKFTSSQGEAQKQTGAQAEAFRQLGVNAFDPAETTLPAVARGLLNIKDQAQRARLETVLFGRAGQEINLVLEQWARGTKVLVKDLTDQGLIMDPKIIAQADAFEKKVGYAFRQTEVAVSHAFDGLVAYGALWDLIQGKVSGKPLAPKPVTPPVAGQGEQRDTKLEQAVAIARAIDVSTERVTFLRSNVRLMQAELENPRATNEMKKNMASAIAAANAEIKTLTDKKVFSGTGFNNAGQEAIAQARLAISEINADQTKGDAQRRAAIDQTYNDLLKNAKLNAAQRIDVEKARNDAIAQANRQAASEQRQLVQSTAETEQRVAQIGFDTKRQALQAEVAAGRMTRQDALAEMLRLTDEETAARLRAIDKAQQGYATGTTFFKQKEGERVVAVAEAEAQKAAIRSQIERESAAESERIWRNTSQQIMAAEQTFTSQLFSGRVGLFGALEAAGLQFAQAEIQQMLRGVTERILLRRTELTADQTMGQMGVMFSWLFESQKTAAAAAGETTRAATKQSARAAGSAADLAMGSASIINDAYKSAAGAYSAVVGIPIVGPILAPIAAGTAFTAVAAFNTLTSFDKGTNYVPRDMPAFIHQGERVVPAADNRALVAAMQGGAANQNGGGGISLTYHEAPGSTKNGRETAKDMVRELQHLRRIGKLK